MGADPEGRNVVHLAETVRRPSAPLGERGRTGTAVYGGFIQTDEYVPELIGQTGLRTLDKMRRSDGMVRATLRALTLPLLAARWKVEPGTDDEKDVAIAEEIERGLMDGMSTSFIDYLRQVLSFLPLGFSVFEPVWEVRPDEEGAPKVMLRKIAPRLQKTISKFHVADDGGLKAITQDVWTEEGHRTIDIEIDRLLVFVNEKEGAGWEGTSILRPAYKHWWIKDQLYRIQAMAAERHGVGIPTVYLPPDRSEDEETIRRAENILSSLRAHERGYLVWPAGYQFDIVTTSKTGGGAAMDVLPMISHHDRMIAVSVLAQFLTLGNGDTGSWALSTDQSGLFLMVEQAIGDYIADIHNRYLIPKWVDFNYPDVQEYPRLTVSNIETRNFAELLTGLAGAANAGLITPDPDLEDALREGMNLPLIPRDENGDPIEPEKEEIPEQLLGPDGQPIAPPPPPGGGGPATAPATNPAEPILPRSTALNAYHPKRDLLPQERVVDFEAHDRALDEARAKISDATQRPVSEIIRSIAERAARAVASGDLSTLQADALPVDTEELERSLRLELNDLYRFGAAQVRDEIKKQIEELRNGQRATMDREVVVAEAYRQAFAEMRAQASGTQANEKLFAALEAALTRPILIEDHRTTPPRPRLRVETDEHGVIKALVPEETK